MFKQLRHEIYGDVYKIQLADLIIVITSDRMAIKVNFLKLFPQYIK